MIFFEVVIEKGEEVKQEVKGQKITKKFKGSQKIIA